jgi:Phage minor capsid protein 2
LAKPEDELTGAFRRAYLLILQSLSNPNPQTTSQIGEALRGLIGISRQWIQRYIPAEYRKGRVRARGSRLRASEEVSGETPSDNIHRRSVEILAHNMYSDLTENIMLVGRRVEDLIREVTVGETLRATETGRPPRDAQRQIVKAMERNGITGYIDSAGREWKPDRFAEMSARTTLAEAQNLGLLNQLEEDGADLVQITSHKSSCPICAIYEGRVYSLSGLSDRWPSLRGTAFSVAYHTIHPNCRHRLAPYSERYADDPAGDRRKSNRPFDDPRTQAAKRAYDEAEKRKRQRRDAQRKSEEEETITSA